MFVRLDYCNGTLVDLPRCELNRLQAVQNAAVRLVAGASRFDHVTPLLRERHWLPVHLRVTYKLAVMVFKSLAATTADYLTAFTHPLESAMTLRLLFAILVSCTFLGQEQPTATAPSPLQAPGCGTVCLIQLNVSPRWAHSSSD